MLACCLLFKEALATNLADYNMQECHNYACPRGLYNTNKYTFMAAGFYIQYRSLLKFYGPMETYPLELNSIPM